MPDAVSPDAPASNAPALPSAQVVGDLVAAMDDLPSVKAALELEAWFVRHIHGSPIARATEVFNQAHVAKETLRGLLVHLNP